MQGEQRTSCVRGNSYANIAYAAVPVLEYTPTTASLANVIASVNAGVMQRHVWRRPSKPMRQERGA